MSVIYGLVIDKLNDELPLGQIAQLVEHCTGITEVSVRVPAQALIFQAFLATT